MALVDIALITYAVIIGIPANLVRTSGISSSITGLLLRYATIGAVEGLRNVLEHVIRLELPITRSIGRKCQVCDILNERIVPATRRATSEG